MTSAPICFFPYEEDKAYQVPSWKFKPNMIIAVNVVLKYLGVSQALIWGREAAGTAWDKITHLPVICMFLPRCNCTQAMDPPLVRNSSRDRSQTLSPVLFGFADHLFQ